MEDVDSKDYDWIRELNQEDYEYLYNLNDVNIMNIMNIIFRIVRKEREKHKASIENGLIKDGEKND